MDDRSSKDELIKELVTLRESEKTYRLYLDAMGDGLLVLDPQKNVMAVNTATVELWGYSAKEEMLNLPFVQLFPKRELNKHYVQMGKAVRTGTVRPFETIALTKSGNEIPVMLAGTAMRDDEGDLQGFAGVFRDITKLKRLENTIKHLTAMEREKLRGDLHDSTSQLLAGARLLATSLARRLSAAHPEAAANATEIALIVGDAQVSIREVAAGLRPLSARPDALVIALFELAVRTEETHGIPCRFTSREHVLIENSEAATQLYLIAQEAVSNATKHSQAGRITVTLSEQNKVLSLVVRDDGIGLSKEQPNAGMGMGIMRNRAKKIEASLDVGHGETGGTVVTCVWKNTPPLA